MDKEGSYSLDRTWLSCKKYVSNKGQLRLFVLAYNQSDFLTRLVLPKNNGHRSLCLTILYWD
ncbi:hypothetical protein LLG96_13840 [bacterium]|nr:hypothetical protein [bacterium]